jgi:CPA2 family monovalent cation:H+ antiporter-2
MHDELPLLVTIALCLSVGLVFGYVTQRLGLSPIVGYLLAGIVVGPNTPGLVADVSIATELAEIGVILLMFGVGLHFRLKDLLDVKWVAIPGAIGQSLVAIALVTLLEVLLGGKFAGGLILGIAFSVASTVVLVRMLHDHQLLDTPAGHVAVGWLVVEDLFTVLVLVLLPTIANAFAGGSGGVLPALGWAVGKLALLTVLLLVLGARIVPKLLRLAAGTNSPELFTLTVLVIALGVALGAAKYFGASMALGAFLAGMITGPSEFGGRAGERAEPLQHMFTALFFVSVGMLFNPRFLVDHPWGVVFAFVIVVVAKPLSALIIVALLGQPVRTGLTVAIGLAQIGEFSFILSALARSLGLLEPVGHDILVVGAILSIMLNPILFRNLDRIERWLQNRQSLWRLLTARCPSSTQGQIPESPGAE